MDAPPPALIAPAAIDRYLRSRPGLVCWRDWITGRRYRVACFHARPEDRPGPLAVIAHSWRDAAVAREIAHAIEQDWPAVPERCRESYDEILFRAPDLVVIQLRRRNLCGCLAHRHVFVREAPFAEAHEALAGAAMGEMDIAYKHVQRWLALPLTDTAFDTKFLEGSRQQDFRAHQLRLKLLSVVLHETHHLVFPQEAETSVRERSLAFYREALIQYVADAVATLSLTIDRSFSRFGE
ncbi:MAG TPA: hypothetical protein VKU44_05270 [Terriglobia bacterium]|nr:hypothetical protein [Terriglobia bacterium]